MKKILLQLIPMVLFAESFLISDIPLPQTSIQDLDPYVCDEYCMQEYIDNDQIFSFLSHAQESLENSDQERVRTIYSTLLNNKIHTNQPQPTVANGEKVRIAILLPYKRIGRYATSTVNASLAYLLKKGTPFELQTYQIEDESVESLQNALITIEENQFNYVIAPLTTSGANNLSTLDFTLHIFVPTVHKKQVDSDLETLYFGAIDYEAQCDLLEEVATSPLVIFSDKSAVGKRLALYEEEKFKYDQEGNLLRGHRVKKYFLPRNVTNLEYYLKKNKRIQNATFFINTPVIKTGMIMSQLTLYDANAVKILSTQVNYNPLILTMTQYEDRKNMLIANSITLHNKEVEQVNAILENDIVYDWINYTTTVGVDMFYSFITGASREYNIELLENQLIYNIEVMQPMYSKFQHYMMPSKSDLSSDFVSSSIF